LDEVACRGHTIDFAVPLMVDFLKRPAALGAVCETRRRRPKVSVRAADGGVIEFPRLTHPRAGLSYAQWRALSPGEKLERLFGMSLDQMAEILSWPAAQLDPARLNAVVTVARVVLLISARAGLFEKAQHERERDRILAEMTRREFGDEA
jgi:hypothetical protein